MLVDPRPVRVDVVFWFAFLNLLEDSISLGWNLESFLGDKEFLTAFIFCPGGIHQMDY
jgi:hypothetical protein